jgi:hypothetical protein
MAELQGEAWHNEQRRKSQDLIRVFNPSELDYTLIWDEGGAQSKFVIPNFNKDMGWGNGMRVMQRYLARKYTNEMVTKIINDRQDRALNDIKKKLAKQGASNIPFNANNELLSTQGIKTDDLTVRQQIEDQVWLGIEEEFGMDRETVPVQPVRTGMEDPFERLDNKRYVKPEVAPSTVTTEPPVIMPEKKGKV